MAETWRDQWMGENKDLARDTGTESKGERFWKDLEWLGEMPWGIPSPFETRGQDKEMEEVPRGDKAEKRELTGSCLLGEAGNKTKLETIL